MVLGYYIIFSAYGFWLPNNPRGSWSKWVASWELFRFGPATKIDTRRSVASKSHDRQLRLAAKDALQYPAVELNGVQAQAVAMGIRELVDQKKITVWACAILPDHVHLVLKREIWSAETMMNRIKGNATRRLLEKNLHPFLDLEGHRTRVPMCWAAKGWRVYLDSTEDIRRAIRYVEKNPIKEGKRAQTWKFITPYTPV